MWLLSHAVYAITSYHQYKSACIAVFCVLFMYIAEYLYSRGNPTERARCEVTTATAS